MQDVTVSVILSHLLFGSLLILTEVLHRLFGCFTSPQHNVVPTLRSQGSLPNFLPSHHKEDDDKDDEVTEQFENIRANFRIATPETCLRNLARRGSFLGGTSGYVSVGDTRNDSCKLWYMHVQGKSPQSPRVMLMSGLFRQMWCVADMVRVCKSQGWEVVSFDKRDVGLSDISTSHVTTQSLAHDAWDLAKSLGWDDPLRGFHIVGESFGGMIAQELALMLPPNVVRSLSLVSTYSGGSVFWTLPPFILNPFPFVSKLVRHYFNHDAHEFQAKLVHEMHGCNDQRLEFHMSKIRERVHMFGGELDHDSPIVKQGFRTHLKQLYAAATHYLSPRRLEELRRKPFPKHVYGPGRRDMLIQSRNSPVLAKAIGAHLIVYSDAGHNITTSSPTFLDDLANGIEQAIAQHVQSIPVDAAGPPTPPTLRKHL